MRTKALFSLLLPMLLVASGGVMAQGTPGAQGMALVSEIGGTARAVAALEDGLLLAEGESLVRLDGVGREVERAAPGRGAVQDLAVRGGAVYTLTETGLSVLALDSLAERVFLPGGGQALAVTDRAVYVAAQQAGLRAALIGADGLPGGWQVIPLPGGAAVDVDVDAAAAYLYVALGDGGVGVYALGDPNVPALVRQITNVGAVQAVDVDGARLFVASGHRLHVYDLPGPAQPVLAGSYDPLHDARGLVLRGEWAYIADAAGGLKRYVFDSLTALRFDRVVWPGEAYDVFDDGRYLYLAAGWDGVIAFDLPGRAHLEARGRVVLPGLASAVAVGGAEGRRRGLAALGAEGVAVIDWRDINAPRLGAVLTLGGSVRAVAMRDTVGFAAVEGVGLVILGLADVSAPTLLATVPLQGAPQSLALGGTLVYAAAGDGGLYVVETIRPAEAAIVGRLLPPRADQPFLHVALEGKRAYISTGAALLIADVDNGEMPQVLSTLSIPAAAAAAREFIAYAIGPRSLTTVNGGSSSAPAVLSTYRAVDAIRAVLSGGEYVWLAGQGDGAQAALLRLSEAGVAEVLTTGHGEGRSLATGQGDAAWLAAGPDGLIALRPGGTSSVRPTVPNGETIRALADGRLLVGGGTGWGILDPVEQSDRWTRGEAPGRIAGLTGMGASIFLALGEGGAARYILPEQGGRPAPAARWSPGASDGSARDVATDGRFVLVAEDGPGAGGTLRVLTAEAMETVTAVSLPGRAQAVAWRDGLAYVAYGQDDGRGGLAVIDVRTPTAGLHTAGSTAFPATGLALAADGRTGYAVGGATLTVFDLSAWPEVRPIRVVRLSRPVSRLILDEAGRRLLGITPGQSVLVLRLDDPNLPVPAAVLETAAQDVAVYGNALYLAVGEGGLQATNLAFLENLVAIVRTLDSTPTAALWRDGETLYAVGAASLRAYDLSDPFAPVQTAILPLEGAGAAHSLAGRATRRDGRWLYVGTETGVWVAHHTPAETLSPGGVVDLDGLLAVGGGWLYARQDAHTLVLAALTDPAQPHRAFAYPLPETSRITAVAAWEGRALVGGPAGVTALEWDAGNSGLPVLLGRIDGLPGEPAAVWVTADTVWVAAGVGGVWRIAVRDPAFPRLEAVIAAAGEARGLALSPDGDRLVVATGQCGVRLLDVTADPPYEVGYWRGAAAADVAAAGDLYAAVGENGLALLREAPEALPVSPSVPFGPSPPDRAEGVSDLVALSWSPHPDPCDGIEYEVRVGVGSDPLERAALTAEPRLVLSDLPPGAAVRWQVAVSDRQGDAAEGPVWEFRTGAAPPATVQPGWDGARVVPPTPTPAPPAAPEASPAVVDTGTGWALLIGGVLLELALLALWWRWRRMLRR